MNIQRFSAPTSREALAKARLAFGDGTLILSNRSTPSGVEWSQPPKTHWQRWTALKHLRIEARRRHHPPDRPHQ